MWLNRSRLLGALLFVVLAIPGPSFASGDATIAGFGGLSLNDVTTQRPSLGGTITVPLVPQLHIVGEVGHLGNVLPTRSSEIFSLAQTGVYASAFYGEGGVRLIAAPHSAVTPYGEATAGFARLDLGSDRLGSIENIATSIALGFVDRTMPIASLGGGLMMRGGPVVVDVGYRYKELFASPALQDTLGLGEPLRSHQVRAGVGIRF
jgi:hypothetical protein